MLPEQDEYTTEELTKQADVSRAMISKLEKLGLLKPSIRRQMGPGGKAFSRRDVANCLRVIALSAVGFTPADAAKYANLVRLFRQITAPFLKKARVELLDATSMLFVPEDLFPEGDPTNIEWAKMPHEWRDNAYEILSSLALTASEVKGKVDRMRKALAMVEKLEGEIADEFLPAIKSAYQEDKTVLGRGYETQLETIRRGFERG